MEALDHCAECHMPRNILGALDTKKWMKGAENPSGRGRIPSLSPDDLDWSLKDIIGYLSSGFTPDFDVAGGSIVAVVENTSQLNSKDIEVIAHYLTDLKN